MKRGLIGLTVLGSAGLLTTIVLTVIEGVNYRVREEQGLDPIYAPTWVAVTSYAGLTVFALAGATLGVTALVAILRRQSRRSSL